MILYKVVNLISRSSCVYGGLSRGYKAGEVTRADSRTMGIFCFASFDDAEEFVIKGKGYDKIIRVRSIGRCRRPKFRFNHMCMELFTQSRRNARTPCPKGTICCPAVKVIEEVVR